MPPPPVSVVSWNLHGIPLLSRSVLVRVTRAVDEVVRRAPDFVLFQEVWTPRLRRYVEVRMAAAGYDIPAVALGGPRWHGGLMTFVGSRVWSPDEPLVFSAFATAAPRWRFWEGDGLAGKGYQVASVASGDARLTLVNTHLQARYFNQHRFIRRAQCLQLAESMAAFARSGPVLIGGDFNSDPEEIAEWCDPFGWRDLTSTRRGGGGCTHLGIFGSCRWTDYVFVAGPAVSSSQVELIANVRRDVPYSDHHGLHAHTRWEEPVR